jgi:hypothetical protein
MKKFIVALSGIFAVGLVHADSLIEVNRMICAASQVQICIENDTCYSASPASLDVPDFVVIDTRKKTISTTKASKQNRSTTFTHAQNVDGQIILQGVEDGRAFSFLIDEGTGIMTVAVARDGITVNVFGSCTDADI